MFEPIETGPTCKRGCGKAARFTVKAVGRNAAGGWYVKPGHQWCKEHADEEARLRNRNR